jgi:hypothetical protein
MSLADKARRTMNKDTTDGGLIDVTELDLDELLSRVDEPSLTSALNRILISSGDTGSYGFNARI